MEELGAKVFFYDERPFNSSYEKALLKVQPNIFAKKTESYFDSIFEEVSNINFDYIFFLKCETPTLKVMKKYRNHFKAAKFCLYMWDSISNVKNIEEKLPYFDLISSFDRKDSLTNNFNFRPLFYSDTYACPYEDKEFEYDICSFGTIHSDRYKVISSVKKIAEKNNLKTYFFNFLQGQFMYYYYKLTNKNFSGSKLTDFSFNKKSSSEITRIILDTQAVLDIQHPNQSGLTMRTIEMLGMNKKIITTNSSITEYDFYSPNNVLVIDRENVEIDLAFFELPFQILSKDIYYKYSLEGWLYEALGGKKQI